jgi:hypothetical protein
MPELTRWQDLHFLILGDLELVAGGAHPAQGRHVEILWK